MVLINCHIKQNIMKINRREFIQKASVAATGAGVFSILPSHVWAARVAPSDQVNVALIGCRNHGFNVLRRHLEYDDARCVALCDVDSNVLQDRAGDVKKDFGQEPKLYGDFRLMLEQQDIDAVIIGTPDHWHCLNFVYACQAGKDIYVEKPLANSIAECDIMVRAAKRYNRVVQVGQQQRSGRAFIEPIQMIKDGYIGKLRKVNIWANFNYGLGAAVTEDSPVPDGVDYDFWLGPAPLRPFNRARFHGSWRHFWDYGSGMMSDWGVHLVDMALWVKDLVEAPDVVMTYAGNTSEQLRMRETFDTYTMIFPKNDFVINFDVTAGAQQGPYEKLYGIAFVGDNATIVVDRQGYRVYPEWDGQSESFKAEEKILTGMTESHGEHARNFLDCVKSRETPVCTPEMGKAAAMHVHIANISGRIGENLLVWDDEQSRFANNEKANQYITPVYRTPWELPKV
jgi:predicted dehydrogenase